MSGDWTELSKAVSRALRHEPWLYELELDHEGWTPVDALVKALAREPRWRDLSRAQLETMIGRSPKQRHEIDGSRIRALYGHSVPGHIAKSPGEPPAVLFHGTAASATAAILAEGLRPMRRQYVHLSVDRDTAYSVGRRKSVAVAVLVIRATHAPRSPVRFARFPSAVSVTAHLGIMMIKVAWVAAAGRRRCRVGAVALRPALVLALRVVSRRRFSRRAA